MIDVIFFVMIRTWNENGLQPVSNSDAVLTMNPLTSIVLLLPINTSNSQALTLDHGKLRNIQLQKFVSANLEVVKADNYDSRGASTWIFGINLYFFQNQIANIRFANRHQFISATSQLKLIIK